MALALLRSFEGASNVLTFLGFHVRLLARIRTPADMFENRVGACPPSHLVPSVLRDAGLEEGAIPGAVKKSKRVPVEPMVCALISSLMFRILALRALSTLLVTRFVQLIDTKSRKSTRRETISSKQVFFTPSESGHALISCLLSQCF